MSASPSDNELIAALGQRVAARAFKADLRTSEGRRTFARGGELLVQLDQIRPFLAERASVAETTRMLQAVSADEVRKYGAATAEPAESPVTSQAPIPTRPLGEDDVRAFARHTCQCASCVTSRNEPRLSSVT